MTKGPKLFQTTKGTLAQKAQKRFMNSSCASCALCAFLWLLMLYKNAVGLVAEWGWGDAGCGRRGDVIERVVLCVNA